MPSGWGVDSLDFSVGGGETAGEGFKTPAGPLSLAFGASAPNPNPTGFPMLPAGFPKPNTLDFCGDVPNALMDCSDEKALPVSELLAFPDMLLPKRGIVNGLAGSLLAFGLSPAAVVSLPVGGLDSSGFPPSPLLPKIEAEGLDGDIVLMLISGVVLGTLNVAKKLGASGLDAKAEDEDASDGFVDASVEFVLELKEPVVPNVKDVFGILESSVLEVPKVNDGLGSSEIDAKGGTVRSFAFELRPKDGAVEDDGGAGGKENALALVAGEAPNGNRLSLAEVDAADVVAVVDKPGKGDGGFGVANWEIKAGVCVVVVGGSGMGDGIAEGLEALSNSDCTVIRRFL